MKKTNLFLLCALCVLCSGNTWASEHMSFAQHKTLTLEALAQREKILQQETQCVQKSSTVEQLKMCFNEAKQNRQTMDKELRPKLSKN